MLDIINCILASLYYISLLSVSDQISKNTVSYRIPITIEYPIAYFLHFFREKEHGSVSFLPIEVMKEGFFDRQNHACV